MLVCSKCKKEKDKTCFYKRADRKRGYRSDCKECYDLYLAQTNGERTNYRKQNSIKKKEYDRVRFQQNKDIIIAERKERRHNDVCYNLTNNLRTRLYNAIKKGWKAGSAVTDLGCSIEFFKDYIEQRFQTGMTWGNYGAWHLDHIKPLANFDLTDREQFLRACYYTNYQPLWAIDNLSKGKKIVK